MKLQNLSIGVPQLNEINFVEAPKFRKGLSGNAYGKMNILPLSNKLEENISSSIPMQSSIFSMHRKQRHNRKMQTAYCFSTDPFWPLHVPTILVNDPTSKSSQAT